MGADRAGSGRRGMTLSALDLFSGIGGFSLGLERTGGFRTAAFCEIDPFCRRVLAKHWPEVPCYDDVRTLTAKRLAADGVTVDVVCGGFPCQDVSRAGPGGGLGGDRSGLWREYARLVSELRPRYAIVENVAALLDRGFGDVLGDLASLGYDAQWDCLPATYAGLPHERDRIWLVAYPHGAVVQRLALTRSPQSEWTERSKQLGAMAASLARVALPAGRRGGITDGVPGRAHRLKALGNAVVPQMPEMLGRAILDVEMRAAA